MTLGVLVGFTSHAAEATSSHLWGVLRIEFTTRPTSISGALRSSEGTDDVAWMLTAGLCVAAAVLPLTICRATRCHDDEVVAVPM